MSTPQSDSDVDNIVRIALDIGEGLLKSGAEIHRVEDAIDHICKAYGAALTLMGSHSVGADTVLALEDACISTMSPQAAVAFLWNDRITPEVSRESLEAQWREEYAAPAIAASQGVVDDLVALPELRARVCTAFYMLARKSSGSFDRRHSNLPL